MVSIKNDRDYNENEYKECLNRNNGLETLAEAEYRFKLLKGRQDNVVDFTETKENIEKLFIESFTYKWYKRVIEKLKANNWTIEEAYNKVKNTGRKLSYISNIKNT